MDEFALIPWAAAGVSAIINALFVALMLVWRARIKDLKESRDMAYERASNLLVALDECYERHDHGTDNTPTPDTDTNDDA